MGEPVFSHLDFPTIIPPAKPHGRMLCCTPSLSAPPAHPCPLSPSLSPITLGPVGCVRACTMPAFPERSYVAHVRESFDGVGPPLPFASETSEAVSSLSEGAGRRDVGELTPCHPYPHRPCLLRVCVEHVSTDISPHSTGEARCRRLLVSLGCFSVHE